MIVKMYWKEVKQFFRKPFNILFMLAAPVILILLMGYAMSNLIGANGFGEKTQSTVLYYVEEETAGADQEKLMEFKEYAENGMDIRFKKIDRFDIGCEEVDRQRAIALIKVSPDGFYYYRSPYNEPVESKILRSACHTFLESSGSLNANSYIEMKEVRLKSVDSYTYFTFAELGLIMMYLSLIVGQSVFLEKETGTFERIYASKANISKMLLCKIILGCTVGALQVGVVYFISSYVLKVNWGGSVIFIFVLYMLLALFSSALGAMLGLYTKKKTALNDKILMLVIILGLLGGGLTPLSYLESIKVISMLCRISPLYWITNSSLTLSRGQMGADFVIAVMVCLALSFLIAGIYLFNRKKEKVKGICIYE